MREEGDGKEIIVIIIRVISHTNGMGRLISAIPRFDREVGQ